MVSLERATRQEAGSAESEVTESLGIIIKTTTQEPKSELKEKKKSCGDGIQGKQATARRYLPCGGGWSRASGERRCAAGGAAGGSPGSAGLFG